MAPNESSSTTLCQYWSNETRNETLVRLDPQSCVPSVTLQLRPAKVHFVALDEITQPLRIKSANGLTQVPVY